MKKNYESAFLAIICVVAFFTYSGVFKGEFVSDDYQYIHSNPYIKDPSWEGIKAIFSNHYFYNYHPVTTMTWALEHSLWKLDPAPYHTTNLLLHLINIILVFVFFRNLTKNGTISLLVAAIFAVHPMNVEVVAWISQRKDLVYTAFYLSSLILYIKYRDKGNLARYLASIALFFLSLLSKPMAVTLPVVLFLIDFYQSKITVRSMLEKIPFFALSVGFGLLTLYTQSGVRMDDEFTPVFPLVDRFFLVSHAVCLYLLKFIFPSGQVLFHFYPISEKGALPVYVYLSPLVILLIGFLVFRLKQYRREIIFGLLLFLTSISVVLQFVPAGCAIISERYTYFPFLGLSFIVAFFYTRVQERNFPKMVKYRNAVTGILALFFLFLVFSAYSRVQVFGKYSSLLNDLVEKQPEHPFSYYSRSNYLLNFKRDPQLALADINKAIELDTNIAGSFSNRGYIRGIMGDFQGSLSDFNQAIAKDSTSAKTYMNRGITLMQLGRFGNAQSDFLHSLRLDSSEAVPYFYLGMALTELHDTSGVLLSYQKALNINGKYAEVYQRRALLHFNRKDYARSVEDFNAYLQLQPDHAESYYNRAAAKFNLNDPTACDDARTAFTLGYKQAQVLLSRCK